MHATASAVSTFAWSLLEHGQFTDGEIAIRDIELVNTELDTAIKDFPAQESFKHIQAWMIHEQGNMHALGKGNAASIESHMQSLRRLRELQKTSSYPARYAQDIKAVCIAISEVGHRFEFEAEKIESLRICLDASSDDAAICNRLAWRLVVVEELELRNLEESQQLVRKAIELQPKQTLFYNTLGVVLFYQNHLTEAEIAFNRSLELATIDRAGDWYFLSRIQYRHGNLQKAKELFQQAESWRQTKQPQDPELRLFSDETRTEISAVFNSP
jgi:predicted Zn-dependent protease